MSLEPIGIFTILAGIFCLMFGARTVAAVFIVFTIFGSAAAIIVGSASIQPAHLFLLFLSLAVVSTEREANRAIEALHIQRPGFWLLCLVVYGAVSAFFLPRLFAGVTAIIPVGSTEYEPTGGAVPLGPVSSNFTQSIYLAADLLCYITIVAVASTKRGFSAVVAGLLAYACMNIVFAFLDMATAATGTQGLMQFMRNAEYTLHADEAIGGLRRIIGSFPETSSFVGTTIAILGFTTTMWLCRRRPWQTGLLSLVSLALILFSTSSTGLVATPVCLLIFYLVALGHSEPSIGRRGNTAIVFLAPQILVLICVVVVLNKPLFQTLYGYVDILILSKSTTASGIERASWNSYGLRNFVDSWGLGVGLGTARTSSFPIALLSNVGVPGTVFFMIFLVLSLGWRRVASRTVFSDIRFSATIGCICLLIGALIAGALVDLGLLFFIMAGLASADPESEHGRVAKLNPPAFRPV